MVLDVEPMDFTLIGLQHLDNSDIRDLFKT